MKTIFLSLYLTLTVVTAFATTQTQSNQDKPWRVFLLSDAQNMTATTHYKDEVYENVGGEYIADDDDGTSENQTWVNYNHSWLDGIGGVGGEYNNWQNDYWDYQGNHYGSAGGMTGNITWDETGYGEEIGVNNDGTTITGFTNSSTVWGRIGNEHCNVSDPVNKTWDNDYSAWDDDNDRGSQHDTYTRTVDTTWHVQTGGRATGNSLWQFDGSAWTVTNKRALPPFNTGDLQAITNNTQIILTDLGALKADGNLWLTLPNGVEKDITPTVTGKDFITFSVGGQKYVPKISARGNGQNYDDLSVTNPKFCVGQLLTFSLNWDVTPSATSRDNIWWHLPEKFVNQATNYSPTCTTYVKNNDLLTNAVQQCWYVNEQGGNCSVHETLHFTNGQNVNIAAAGGFVIDRPEVDFALSSAGPINFNTNNGVLKSGDITFKATVAANFAGVLNWTQLIKRQAYGNGQWLQNTYGNFYLDNDPLYNTVTDTNGNNVGTPPTNTPIGSDAVAVINFEDSPTIQCEPLNSWINDSFKTYLVFKPDGDGSIWVTLGRADWGWSALVSWYFGWDFDAGSLTQPSYTDLDEFPVWPDILHNSKTQ